MFTPRSSPMVRSAAPWWGPHERGSRWDTCPEAIAPLPMRDARVAPMLPKFGHQAFILRHVHSYHVEADEDRRRLPRLPINSARAGRPSRQSDVQPAKLIGDRVPGRSTDCIDLSSISSSQIVEGRAIVYRVGSRLYVIEPRSGAASLREDDIFLTLTLGAQLCSIDIVNLVDRASRLPMGFVSLGQFVPYTKASRAN